MKTLALNLQPNLFGSLLCLRPLKLADYEDLYHVAADPLIWEQHPQRLRYERSVFKDFFDLAIKSNGALLVLDAKTGKPIGTSRFYDFKPESREIIIGYTFLSRAYWGGAFNRELKFLMLNHIYTWVDRVLFEIGSKNIRSRKAIERIGAQFVKECTLDGKDHVVYKVDKTDFATSTYFANMH